jgi:gliding motility-associated-like protein
LHFDLSAAGESFLWQDGSTFPSYNISNAGKYYVTVTAGGCSKTDTINVTVKKIPMPDLGPDKTICKDDVIILFPGKLDGSYLWQDSSVNLTYRVTKGGSYRVVVSNKCGSGSDDIDVKFKDCKIYWPTAFTPNNDGKNDVFRVLSNASFNKFKLQIFNRWGELLFTSNNSAQGWDGNYKDTPQLPGSYVWAVEYVDRAGMKLEDKGFVLLIR